MKNVTIKDVAKAAGVSYSTVSRALSGSPEISADTRERILQFCKEMNYTTNAVARAMVLKSTKMIGLIMPSILNPFMSELAHHLNHQARARGFKLITSTSSRDLDLEQELFEMMIGHQVDGIVLIPTSPDSYKNLSPYLRRVPTVFVGENLRDVPESYVSVDNYRGAYMGVEYLYNLGHRDILYFGRRRNNTTHQMRSDGYEQACRDLGLTPRFFNNNFPRSSVKYGYQQAKQLFAQDRSYTAVFAATDTNALGLMKAAEELGIRIPEDLSLLGFDNVRQSELPHINLSTIDQPQKMLASIAVDTLVDIIQNENAGYSHRVLSATLVERKTCAPLVPKE